MFIFVIIVSEVFMKIILVRHGKTQANIDWKYSTDDTVLAKDGLYILDKTKKLLEDYDKKNLFDVEEYLTNRDKVKLKSSYKINRLNI